MSYEDFAAISQLLTAGYYCGLAVAPAANCLFLIIPGGQKVFFPVFAVFLAIFPSGSREIGGFDGVISQCPASVARPYSNGVTQTNVFDTAGRITGLSHTAPNAQTSTNSTIQVALNYAYDLNGNKTGSSESRVFNWPQPSLTDDNTGYTPAGKLINRQVQNNSATSNQLSTVAYHYDSSGNMTNAVMTTGGSTAQSWTLTYDEDNRTTSIFWQVPPLTSRMITNRYDALGRRISKTVDGTTTGYVLLLAGGMGKILCDLDGNGNVTAWYVHGPDLCYRVDSTNGLLCYHADAQANITAVS